VGENCGKSRKRIYVLRLLEVQKAGRLADNPKRQSLVGGGLERATLPFSGFQRAEPFGGYEVEKKSGERLLKCTSKIELYLSNFRGALHAML